MPPTPDTDAALFEQLRPRLTAISRRILGSDAEAEDVVQDSFIKWQGVDRSALATPAAWLTTVVRHGSIDRLRQHVRDALAAQAAADLVPAMAPAPPDAGLLRRAELEAALARLFGKLSPAERLALVLHEVFECRHADIAAVLGIRTATARQHLARARRRLQAPGVEAPWIEAPQAEAVPEEKPCRALVLRFQAAINGRDVAAMVSLLAGEQPVSVREPASMPTRTRACANDAVYGVANAA